MRSQSLQGPGPSSVLKRPFSPEQPSFAGGRLLVPKPPMSTIGNILNEPIEPPKKKRGRPTNAEKAARSQQEQIRGQPAPPPKRVLPIASSSNTFAPGPLSIATYAAQAAMTPQVRDRPASAGASETSSGKKKRGRPPNTEKEARHEQPEPQEPTVLEPSRPGPSRYPNILSPEEDTGEGSSRRQEGSPSRGDPTTYR